MQLESALKGMARHREALLEKGSASNPSHISENTHRLTQYISIADERVGELEYDLEINEAKAFHEYLKEGKSANAAKEIIRRDFVKERATIARTNRLISSGWKLVSECQSRVKHLIAEANNQI